MTYPATPTPAQSAQQTKPAKQYAANQLKEGSQILVDGRISFSRIASFITGAERDQRNQGQTYPINFDYTSLGLSHAAVRFKDAQAATYEEMFIHERLYTSPTKPDNGLNYSIDNKSNRLPQVWVPALDEAGNPTGAHEQLEGLEGELDNGLKATILLEVYKTSQPNRGIRLNAVFLHEPLRYYARGFNTGELAALGIVLNGSPKDSVQLVPNNQGVQQSANTDANGLPLPGQGYGAPAPQQAAPQPQYQQSAPQAQPAPAPVAQFQQAAPQAPAQPAQQQYQAPLPAGNPLAAGQPVAPQAPLNQPAPAVQQAMPTQAPQTPAQPVQPPAPQAGSAFTDAPGAVPQAPAVQAVPVVAQAPVAPVVDMTEPASPWDLPAAPSQPAQPTQGITYPA